MKIISDIKELWNYRELIFNITQREIKVRYKQSILGCLWAILQPLSLMVMFTVIFSKFAKIPSDGFPYPIFSYCALLPWTFFSTSLSFAIPSLVTNERLITKIYFPREIFPISSILAAFVDFLIAGYIFLILIIIYKIQLTINIVFIPILIFIQIVLTVGVSLFASGINVYYRDVRYALPLIIQLWMYASPVIYPISIVPENLRWIYMLNPMAGIIDGYRKVILHGTHPDFYSLGLSFVGAIVLLYLSYLFFKHIEMRFADII